MMRMIALFFALLLSYPVYAADLSGAKQARLIGEQPNGYLGLVTTSASLGVKALVVEINQKRKSYYQAIANKNGISLAKVEALAGQKAIAKTPKGQYIRTTSGQWVEK